MSPTTNARLLFKEVPKGLPETGKTTVVDTSQSIDLEATSIPANGVLIKVLMVSADPYLRGKMRDPSVKSYSPAFELGQPIYGYGVGVILRSEHAGFKPGDHVTSATLPWVQYAVQVPVTSGPTSLRVTPNEARVPWSVHLGALGMPGRTAYFGWKEYAKPKSGEVAFVTTGGGPVGSMVIQLAKQDGLKVIASAGSDDKVAFMKSIGADVAFNYKTTSTQDILEKHGPIDVFWDNVGWETLDIALGNAAPFARFIECGMISGYQHPNGGTMKNLGLIVGRRISIFGFIQFDHEAKYLDQFYKEIGPKVASGNIKYTEDVVVGLEQAGEAILNVYLGKNTGKSVIVVGEE